jgi:hypothetical protein
LHRPRRRRVDAARAAQAASAARSTKSSHASSRARRTPDTVRDPVGHWFECDPTSPSLTSFRSKLINRLQRKLGARYRQFDRRRRPCSAAWRTGRADLAVRPARGFGRRSAQIIERFSAPTGSARCRPLRRPRWRAGNFSAQVFSRIAQSVRGRGRAQAASRPARRATRADAECAIRRRHTGRRPASRGSCGEPRPCASIRSRSA